MFYSFFFCLTEEHVRIRFMFSTSFHEFVPKQRLTEWEWFGYLEVRGKASWEDALRGCFLVVI
jgi:hypothetical protein